VAIRPGLKGVSWIAAGTVVLVGVMLVALRFHKEDTLAAQVAFKTRRVEAIDRIRLDLATSSEAEKSAVMAITDQESQNFADRARAASAAVDDERIELERLVGQSGTRNETELLSQFSRAFAECQRIDSELLGLAVKNTNLKAYSLDFGPAAEALREMDGALSRMIAEYATSGAPEAKQVMLFASGAQSGALRIQSLLPPHISEESDPKMDQLETLMAKEDFEVRKELAGLHSVLGPGGSSDLRTADAGYARFSDIRKEVLQLSRQNTNVRSLTISLNQKRAAVLMCQDALAALEKAVREEPVSDATPDLPR
jgi:hypothetical protein